MFIDNIENTQSGVFTMLKGLSSALIAKGIDITIAGGSSNGFKEFFPGETRSFKFKGPNSLNHLEGFRQWIQPNIKTYDFVFIHSMWSVSSGILAKISHRNNVPFIVVAHGMLNPYALQLSRIKKKIFKFFFGTLFNRATYFYALSEIERSFIRDFNIKSPVIVLPNGIEIVSSLSSEERNLILNDFNLTHNAYILFVGRLHPIKNLENLIAAWNNYENPYNYKLIIVGSGDESYESSLKSKVDFRIKDSVEFLGKRYGKELIALYQGCVFTILPSKSEAFPMVLLESQMHSKICLMSNIFQDELLVNKGSVIPMENTVQGILSGIIQTCNFSQEDLVLLGKRGRKTVIKHYSWNSIVTKLLNHLYLNMKA